MQPVDELAKRIKIYREASANCTDPITRVKNNKAAPYTLVHCVESMEEAESYGVWDSVGWWYDHMAQFIIDWELPPNMPQEEIEKAFPRLRDVQAGKVDPKFFNDQDMIIIGEPDQCLEKLERYQEIGCDSVICYMQFGQLKHNEIMESIEPLGKHVIPKLEQRADAHARAGTASDARDERRATGERRTRRGRPHARRAARRTGRTPSRRPSPRCPRCARAELEPPPQCFDPALPRTRCLVRTRLRPAGTILESRPALAAEPLPPLVCRRARDPHLIGDCATGRPHWIRSTNVRRPSGVSFGTVHQSLRGCV